MTVFVILRVADPPRMKAAIAANFPDDSIELQSDEWLISATGTAQEMAIRLGVNKLEGGGGETGAAIICSIGNYWGRAATEIWEWIKTKMEKSGG